MKLYVGTSGYAYKPWRGIFYPRDLADSQMLAFYARSFRSVEINNTFYRMPKPAVLEAWAGQVPAAFRFALKCPQAITHFQRLRNSEESLARLLDVASVLGKRLGPILFQLPPNFRKDVERLSAFLELIPAGVRAAFEFRHTSWFEDEVFALLKKHRAAMCIAEADDDLDVPLVATATWGYFRLRRLSYRPADLRKWAKQLASGSWGEAYVYFKHEDEALGPAFALDFIRAAKRMLE